MGQEAEQREEWKREGGGSMGHFLLRKPVLNHVNRTLLLFPHKLSGCDPLFSRSTRLLCRWSYLLGGWGCLLGGMNIADMLQKWAVLVDGLEGLQHSLRRCGLQGYFIAVWVLRKSRTNQHIEPCQSTAFSFLT